LELDNERASWSSNNAGGAFASPLKFTIGGARDLSNGSLIAVSDFGFYWTSTVNGNFSRLLRINSGSASVENDPRSAGYSVRCIKD
jgi:hypothetical protein